MFDKKYFFGNLIEIEKEYDSSKNIKDKSIINNIKKKFITPKLFELDLSEKNNRLDIMLNDLAFYKNERNEIQAKDFKNYKTPVFKNLLFNNLERNLMEISYINNKEKRNEKINKIFAWYKDKKALEKDIKTITYKTYNEKNEISLKDFLSKKFTKKLKKITLNKNHRNLELVNKKMLNEYKRKILSKPFYALKKSISYCSRNDYDESKGNFFAKNYINKKSFLTPVNNYSRSFLCKSKSFNDLFFDKKINEEQNRLIAIKRNAEEIKEKIKEYGAIKSKFKGNLNNKFEKKHLINLYVNKEDLSSFLLKKYNSKEKEKEAKIKLEKNKKNKKENIITEENDNDSPFKRERSYSHKIQFTSFDPKISPNKSSENENEKNSTHPNKKIKSTRSSSLKKKQKYNLKKFSLKNFARLINFKLFSGKNNKIVTNQIQNIENETKNVKSTDNISIKEYKIKFPQEKSFSDLMTKNKKEKNKDAFPDIISKDILNKRILNYRQLCKLNTNDEKNLNDSEIIKSLNKYNYEELNMNNKVAGKHFEKLRNKYNKFKDNLLKMRLSISFDKKQEFENLMKKIRTKKFNSLELNDEDDNYLAEKEDMKNDTLFEFRFKRKHQNKNINYSLFHALVNPNDNSNYSKYYLPRSGSMLLLKDIPKKFF